MGCGSVGEWPSGGRAWQGKCQTSVFLTTFRKTNDQFEKNCKFCKKKSVYSLAKFVIQGVPYQHGFHQHDFHQHHILAYADVSGGICISSVDQSSPPSMKFWYQRFFQAKNCAKWGPLVHKDLLVCYHTCERNILYSLLKKRIGPMNQNIIIVFYCILPHPKVI